MDADRSAATAHPPVTVREALERSGMRARIFVDSAEGIRAPRSRRAIQEVSAGMLRIFNEVARRAER